MKLCNTFITCLVTWGLGPKIAIAIIVKKVFVAFAGYSLVLLKPLLLESKTLANWFL